VFVTGSSQGSGTSADYATIAYNAATGARLWVRRYNDSRNGEDLPTALALSPDGRTVFVTGSSGSGHREDFATIAYSAATGAKLWIRSYDGPVSSFDVPYAMAASPDGHMVVVTGSSFGRGTGEDFATVAYNATSGKRVRRCNGPANGGDQAVSVAISPNARTVYVTGFSAPSDTALRARYITIAYGAAIGRRRWLSSYAGPRHGGDLAQSVAVGPAGHRVFVTGFSHGVTSRADYATIAYSAATGARLWARRYNGPGNGEDFARAMTVGSDGAVYVTGVSAVDNLGEDDATTIAYPG
jgi:hypothetical protein